MSSMSSMTEEDPWKWSYSKMFGVMYGPVPVGIIVVVNGASAYYGTR